MTSIRCLLGRHDYLYVGEVTEKPNAWTTLGWNVLCLRCWHTAHFSRYTLARSRVTGWPDGAAS